MSIRRLIGRTLKKYVRPALSHYQPPPAKSETELFAERLGFTAIDLADIILDTTELRAIVTEIQARPGGSLLVFGCGHDSLFWEGVNRGGTTAFLEDTPEWADVARSRLQLSAIHLVHYGTKRSQWEALLENPAKLEMDLPADIRSRRWDVILVDAPLGYDDEHPGRMKSIYAASRLIAPGGRIFLHDCERTVEDEYASRYFGRERMFIEIRGRGGLLRGYAF